MWGIRIMMSSTLSCESFLILSYIYKSWWMCFTRLLPGRKDTTKAIKNTFYTLLIQKIRFFSFLCIWLFAGRQLLTELLLKSCTLWKRCYGLLEENSTLDLIISYNKVSIKWLDETKNIMVPLERGSFAKSAYHKWHEKI